MRSGRFGFFLVVTTLACALSSLADAAPPPASGVDGKHVVARIPEEVLGKLQVARADAGLAGFVRDETLDAIAGRRARQVADLPFEGRMSPRGSIQSLVRDAGIRRYRSVAEHIEIQSGYPDPAEAVMQRWRKYGNDWSNVLDPSQSEIGLAAARSEDDMLVFVAVLLSPAEPIRDPRALEKETEAAINEVRRSHGVAPLEHSDELAAVARAHSEDMAKRDYFAHRSPEGTRPSDRAARHGIAYSRLAENIAENEGAESPVDTAVRGWLDSAPHRENLLSPGFLRTGIGIAVTEDGEIYFTQLFLTPLSFESEE